MAAAVNAVMVQGLSFRMAARKYGVSRSSLFEKVQEKRGKVSEPRKPHLTAADERELVEQGLKIAHLGKKEVKRTLTNMAAEMALKNGCPFKNYQPSQVWWIRFRKMHGELNAALGERTEYLF